MRVNLKSGAASAAAVFLLLLILSLTWPGHGIWLLLVGILIGLAAAYLWWRDHSPSNQGGPSPDQFSNVGAYGLSGAALESTRQPTAGVPLAIVLAPISALAILLFIGGAIGSADDAVQQTPTTLEQNVSVIDRSRDGEPATPQVDPPSTSQIQQPQTTTTVSAASTVSPPQPSTATPDASTETPQTAAPVKPIVVAAPQTASAVEDDADDANAVPQSANTIEYIVEEGDTLYDIAERYDSTVDAIMTLNQLNATSFIHPGDILLIPMAPADGEES